LGFFLYFLALLNAQPMSLDGKSDRKWDKKIRAELAPELRSLYDRTPVTEVDDLERLKNSLDNGLPIDQFAADISHNMPVMTLIQGIIGNMEPGFKMPPGASFAMAPASGHMTFSTENGEYGIPNSEKNHISAIQRDAIGAGLGTLRAFTNEQSFGKADERGTRQTVTHKRFPSYGHFLNAMMNNYAISNGFGIGALPLMGMKATSMMNPMFPISPGPLGSGVDLLGLKNAQMVKTLDKNSNPLLPFGFLPTTFEVNGPNNAFNLPTAVVAQTKNNMLNVLPKAFSYASSLSANTLSGVQPMFV